jgi:endoglucanase
VLIAEMRARARLIVAVVLLLAPATPAARAEVPAARLATLAHGINFTNWFRYPASQDDAHFRDYISDATLTQLRRDGFTFVRLAAQPELMLRDGRPDPHRLGLLAAAVARIERHGLGVVVGWHPQTWHLESSAAEQQELQDLWGAFAQRLRPLDAALTFPEVLNEPVFAKTEPAWETLQIKVLARIRAALPNATVMLTGTGWGSLDGLLGLHPVADGNVVYSFHTYEPPVLTSLGSFEPTLDHAALAHLPFPVEGAHACDAAEGATSDARTRDVIRYYCSQHWDAASLRQLADKAADWGRRNHATVVCGEFGATDQLPPATRLAWIAAMRRALEANGIGWALWGYDDSMGFDIHPDRIPHRGIDPALLRALGLGSHA